MGTTLSVNIFLASAPVLDSIPYLYDGQHGIDPDKVEIYLSQISVERYRDIVFNIIKNTIYITMSELLEKLGENIDKFLENNREDFFVLLPDKLGSDHYLLSKFWQKIKGDPYFGGLVDIKTDITQLESKSFVIVDDAIYSGIHTLSSIDNLTHNYFKRLLGSKYFMETKLLRRELAKPFKFHILTPYISTAGEKEIGMFVDDLGLSVIYYTEERLESLRDIYKDFPKEYSYIYKKLGMEADAIPIYFDHKVAKSFSSFPQIYINGWLGKGIYNPDDIQDSNMAYGTILYRLPDRPEGI